MSINEPNGPKNEIFAVLSDGTAMQHLSKLNEKNFLLIDTGISPRVFNNWKKMGLLPQESTERKWNKFSFTEFIWLKIVQELREFGLSIEKILKVRKLLYKNPLDGVNMDELFKSYLKAILNDIETSTYTKEEKEVIKKGFEDPEAVKKTFEKEMHLLPPLLSFMVLNSIFHRRNNGIVIFSSGECREWLDEFYIIDKSFSKFLDRPHIFISLSTFIFEYLLNEKDSYSSVLNILSHEEQEIVNLLKTKELKEITIKFNKGKAYMLEATSGKEVSKDQAEEIMKNMIFKNYQSITFKTNSNKMVYIENKQKRQL